jgi:hypothetical protein
MSTFVERSMSSNVGIGAGPTGVCQARAAATASEATRAKKENLKFMTLASFISSG